MILVAMTQIWLVVNCFVVFLLSLQTKVKEGLDETLGVADKSISDAEAWDKPTTLSDDLEQATAEIQQSMVIIHQL